MPDRPIAPVVSAVVPCLDEEENLRPFLDRVRPVLDEQFGPQWEVLFVDDGSTDRTPQIIADLHTEDNRIRTVRLSRNFGSHVAIAAGLDHATGDLAVVLAADLQDPPETIPAFVERWRAGYDIVWGARTTRDDPFARRLFARLFYGAIVRTALPDIPRSGTGSFCLIDRTVIDAFRQFEERNRLTFGIISWSGFSQTQVSYERQCRHGGRSKWSLAMLVKTAIDTFVSFSYLPLRTISYLGMVVSAVAFAFAIYVMLDYAFNGTSLQGWPSLMAAILFLGGAQLVTLGVLGEYVWRISEEAKRRPLYLVERRLGVHPRAPQHDQLGV